MSDPTNTITVVTSTTLTHIPADAVHQPAPYERWLAAQPVVQDQPYRGRHRGQAATEAHSAMTEIEVAGRRGRAI